MIFLLLALNFKFFLCLCIGSLFLNFSSKLFAHYAVFHFFEVLSIVAWSWTSLSYRPRCCWLTIVSHISYKCFPLLNLLKQWLYLIILSLVHSLRNVYGLCPRMILSRLLRELSWRSRIIWHWWSRYIFLTNSIRICAPVSLSIFIKSKTTNSRGTEVVNRHLQ